MLEDLDDELKEIVLQSSEQIDDIYKKLEQLKKRSTEIFDYTEAEDQKILRQMKDALRDQKEFIDQLQLEVIEDRKRRIKDKSDADLAFLKVQMDIAHLVERDQQK